MMHSCRTDPEMCIVGVWNNSYEDAGDADWAEKKRNKDRLLASLGNLLLPGANVGTSFNTIK